ISEGATAGDAIASSVRSAQLADRLGYRRLWFAEHHNTVNLAASATSVLISHAAAATERIRVGSGGVMLPNHAPLMVAEQYGTLANIHGDRIDLGLGRAPGTDGMTAQALARSSAEPQAFAQNIYDLQGWFSASGKAYPMPITCAGSAGMDAPPEVLGSTMAGASIAGQLGLPCSLAAHCAPTQSGIAIKTYRDSFTADAPTAQIVEPYVMAGINVMVADTDAEAARQFTSVQQMFNDLRTGRRRNLQPPVDPADIAAQGGTSPMLQVSAVGSPDTATAQMAEFVQRTGADELITITYA